MATRRLTTPEARKVDGAYDFRRGHDGIWRASEKRPGLPWIGGARSKGELRYHALLMLEAHDRSITKCRVCGCTDDDCHQCIEKTGEPCYWVEPNLCSACVNSASSAPPRETSSAQEATP